MPNAAFSDRHARLVLRAARLRDQARLRHRPLQVALSRFLAPANLAILAPVIDSLLQLFEAALGRPVIVGSRQVESEDEHLLLSLLAGTRGRTVCLACSPNAARDLHCAVRSARIMIDLASADRSMIDRSSLTAVAAPRSVNE